MNKTIIISVIIVIACYATLFLGMSSTFLILLAARIIVGTIIDSNDIEFEGIDTDLLLIITNFETYLLVRFIKALADLL